MSAIEWEEKKEILEFGSNFVLCSRKCGCGFKIYEYVKVDEGKFMILEINSKTKAIFF